MTSPARGSVPPLGRVAERLLAVTVGGAGSIDVALTRINELEAKLLAQTESPADASLTPGPASTGGAMRMDWPLIRPEFASMRVTIPWEASPTNR
jgi:hypothetical protein